MHMRVLREQLRVDAHKLVVSLTPALFTSFKSLMNSAYFHPFQAQFKSDDSFLTRAWWYPFSSLHKQLELRVFRILFLERFNLSR